MESAYSKISQYDELLQQRKLLEQHHTQVLRQYEQLQAKKLEMQFGFKLRNEELEKRLQEEMNYLARQVEQNQIKLGRLDAMLEIELRKVPPTTVTTTAPAGPWTLPSSFALPSLPFSYSMEASLPSNAAPPNLLTGEARPNGAPPAPVKKESKASRKRRRDERNREREKLREQLQKQLNQKQQEGGTPAIESKLKDPDDQVWINIGTEVVKNILEAQKKFSEQTKSTANKELSKWIEGGKGQEITASKPTSPPTSTSTTSVGTTTVTTTTTSMGTATVTIQND